MISRLPWKALCLECKLRSDTKTYKGIIWLYPSESDNFYKEEDGVHDRMIYDRSRARGTPFLFVRCQGSGDFPISGIPVQRSMTMMTTVNKHYML